MKKILHREPKPSAAAGRVSPGGILLVVILVGLALVAGWWYGQKEPSPRPDFPALKEKKEREDVKRLPAPPFPRGGDDSAGVLILEDRIADVAEKAMLSVVNISSEKVIRVQNSGFFFFGPWLWEVPRDRRERSLGSGVVVTEDGYILTNNHIVESASSVMVALADKREFPAKVVGTDPETDLAVLKIEAEGLPALVMGDSDKVRVGQVVLAIGNPFGFSQTVTMGIISARGRSKVGITDYEDFLQTDAAINPGNSGGALINLKGELIGINTAIFSRTGGNIGIGFAIPSNLARTIMNTLVEKGSVVRGFLGVELMEMTPELAPAFGLAEARGAVVKEVAKGSPGEEAGLLPGDVIVELSGREVQDFTDLRNRIAEMDPGTKVTLGVLRHKKRITLSATLAKRPSRFNPRQLGSVPSPHQGERFAEFAGMKVADLNPQLADQLGIEQGAGGVAVVDVDADSRAERAGIMVGDVIVMLDHAPVKNLTDFVNITRRFDSQPVLVNLRREGQNLFLVIPRI